MRGYLGAFVGQAVHIPGAASGPLSDLTFAAKDVFDIAGFRTGAGNPDWLDSHPAATRTASAVQALLDAGATLIGKTVTDELTYSLNGENAHYGTPVNPNAAGRVPGGSSSGSASAVAGGLCDFALGTDTGGSVRLPASNCGIFGFRPTHGLVANDLVVPLAPSFDTVGWFSRDPEILRRAGQVLLGESNGQERPPRLLLAADAFDLADPDCRPSLDAAAGAVEQVLGTARSIELFAGRAEDWMNAFRLLQGAEAWACHGEWINAQRPQLASDIHGRFEWASTIRANALPPARAVRHRVRQRLLELLGRDGVLCLPSAPSIALPLNTAGPELESFRSRALALLCVAGLAGLPQLSLPLARCASCPLGISLIGPQNSDQRLLALALECNSIRA